MLMGAPLPWRWHSFAVAGCNLTHLLTASYYAHHVSHYMCLHTCALGVSVMQPPYTCTCMYMYTD